MRCLRPRKIYTTSNRLPREVLESVRRVIRSTPGSHSLALSKSARSAKASSTGPAHSNSRRYRVESRGLQRMDVPRARVAGLAELLDREFGDELLGLYLFGSLPAGGFVEGRSDIDLRGGLERDWTRARSPPRADACRLRIGASGLGRTCGGRLPQPQGHPDACGNTEGTNRDRSRRAPEQEGDRMGLGAQLARRLHPGRGDSRAAAARSSARRSQPRRSTRRPRAAPGVAGACPPSRARLRPGRTGLHRRHGLPCASRAGNGRAGHEGGGGRWAAARYPEWGAFIGEALAAHRADLAGPHARTIAFVDFAPASRASATDSARRGSTQFGRGKWHV